MDDFTPSTELTHVEDMLDRLVAMGKECIDALNLFETAVDGVPFFYHAQESFPFWTWRVDGAAMELESEDFDVRTYTVIGSFYGGYLTSGYRGELERKIQRCNAAVPMYFNARPYGHTRQFLTVDVPPPTHPEYGTPMGDIDPRGVRCTDFVGFVRPQAVVGGGSTPASVLGTDYVFEVPFVFRTREEW